MTPVAFDPSAKSAHLHGLDLLRAAMAFAVGVFHLTWRYPPLAAAPPLGWVGVQVFFVLSGFVIAASAAKARPRDFLVRRFLRLYPAAWICVPMVVLASLATGDAAARIEVSTHADAPTFAASMLLVGDLFVASAFWTLQVEIAFYLLIAAVALIARRRGGPPLEGVGRALILWSGFWLALEAASRAAGWGLSPVEIGYGWANVTLVRYGHYFGLGILIWAASADGGLRRRAPWIALAGALALFEIALRSGEIYRYAAGDMRVAAIAAGASAAWAASCAVLAWSAFGGWGPRPGSPASRLVRTLGLASYPFYLLHEGVGGNLMGAMVARGVPGLAALVAALLATGAISIVVVLVLEPRLRRLLGAGLHRSRLVPDVTGARR